MNRLEVFRHGLENLKSTDKIELQNLNYSRRYRVSVAYYIVTAFMARVKRINKDIYIASRADKTELFNNSSDISTIYRPRCIKRVGDIVFKTTFLSPFSVSERIKIIIGAINSGKKYVKRNDIKKNDLSFWIDFYILDYFIRNQEIKRIIHRFHYDEKATWIGELKKKYKYDIEIYQHGVVGGEIKVPHRIISDRTYCFDQYSINYFQTNVLDKYSCRNTVIYQFPPSVSFQELPIMNDNEIPIGIADQNKYEWTRTVVEGLSGVGKFRIIVMLHPESRKIKYRDLLQLNNVMITDIKYSGLKALITDYSSLAIDYYRADKTCHIYYTGELAKNMFMDYPFRYCDNLSSIPSMVLEDCVGDRV